VAFPQRSRAAAADIVRRSVTYAFELTGKWRDLRAAV